MALSTEEKQTIIKEYATGEGDTGSPEVQVALLTAGINDLQAHFKQAYPRSPLTPRTDPHGQQQEETARLPQGQGC